MKDNLTTNASNEAESPAFLVGAVSRSLFDLSVEEKYDYLRKKVYEKVKHSSTGKLLISTSYCRKVAELLGGNYDELSKIQRDIFKSEIVFEYIYVEGGFDRYIR